MWRSLTVATLVAAALHGGPAAAQDADVMHWWTSGGESRAIAVFAKEYNKRGGKWIDDASVGPAAEHAAALNRIAGGNPPTALQWNIGIAVRQFVAALNGEQVKGESGLDVVQAQMERVIQITSFDADRCGWLLAGVVGVLGQTRQELGVGDDQGELGFFFVGEDAAGGRQKCGGREGQTDEQSAAAAAKLVSQIGKHGVGVSLRVVGGSGGVCAAAMPAQYGWRTADPPKGPGSCLKNSRKRAYSGLGQSRT